MRRLKRVKLTNKFNKFELSNSASRSLTVIVCVMENSGIYTNATTIAGESIHSVSCDAGVSALNTPEKSHVFRFS
jgi:hypothetical protein